MLSMAFDPAAFGDAGEFDDDVARLVAWVKASPPVAAGGRVLLPGEIEQETRSERLTNGLPIDDATWRQICATAEGLGVAIPTE